MTAGVNTTGAAHRWLVLAVVLGCFLPAAVDVTILNIAVPALSEAMQVSAREMLWIVDVYSLMMIGLVLVTGPLGDRIGHQRLLLIGLGVFGIASGLASLSTTPGALIAGRAAIAVGAAMIIPATLAIIRQAFHDERERAFAIGAWSAVAAGASAIGPVAGGFLLHYFWWGSIFLVNVPIAVLAIPIVAVVLRNDVAEDKQPWEATSPTLAVVGSLSIAYGIIALAHHGMSAFEVLVPGLFGIAVVAVFVRRQRRARHPMLDVSLFAEPRFRSGVLASTLPILVMVGFELQLVQYLQFAVGLSPRDAAIHLLPMPLAALVAGPLTGYFVGWVGARTGVRFGLGVAAVGYVVVAMSVSPKAGAWLACGLVLVGAGHGVVQMIASDLIMTAAPPDRAGGAAAVESVSYEAGAGLGVAVVGSLMGLAYRWYFAVPGDVGSEVPPGAADSIAEALTAAGHLGGTTGATVASAAGSAFVSGFQALAFGCAVVVAATVLIATPPPLAASEEVDSRR